MNELTGILKVLVHILRWTINLIYLKYRKHANDQYFLFLAFNNLLYND